MMKLHDLRTGLLGALLLAAAACDSAALAPETALPGGGPAFDKPHPCTPTLSGPTTSSSGATAIFYFYYTTGCNFEGVTWSVDQDAAITPLSPTLFAPAGMTQGGRAQVVAGSCDYQVTATATFDGAPVAKQWNVSLGYDCVPPSFVLTTTGLTLGTALSWNDVSAYQYEVRRSVRPAGGSFGPWQLMSTTTALGWTDGQYRPAHHSSYTHVVQYQVTARRSGGPDVVATTTHYAESTSLNPGKGG